MFLDNQTKLIKKIVIVLSSTFSNNFATKKATDHRLDRNKKTHLTYDKMFEHRYTKSHQHLNIVSNKPSSLIREKRITDST